jgi:hypothetical protein
VLQIVLTVGTWLAFAATATYAYFTIRQWRELISARHQAQYALDAATRSARAAENSVTNQQKAFVIDQRPYLVGQPPVFSGLPFAPNTSLHANLIYKNIGRTPAMKDFTYIRLLPYHALKNVTPELRRAALRKFLADQFSEVRKKENLFREEVSRFPQGENDMAPGADSFTSNQGDDVVLSPAEFAEIQKPDTYVFLILVGLSTYTDSFGNPYETEHCWFYAGKDPTIWHKCQGYNAIR